jgi:hypothetical protein
MQSKPAITPLAMSYTCLVQAKREKFHLPVSGQLHISCLLTTDNYNDNDNYNYQYFSTYHALHRILVYVYTHIVYNIVP